LDLWNGESTVDQSEFDGMIDTLTEFVEAARQKQLLSADACGKIANACIKGLRLALLNKEFEPMTHVAEAVEQGSLDHALRLLKNAKETYRSWKR
jgi:hypothetical protein